MSLIGFGSVRFGFEFHGLSVYRLNGLSVSSYVVRFKGLKVSRLKKHSYIFSIGFNF